MPKSKTYITKVLILSGVFFILFTKAFSQEKRVIDTTIDYNKLYGFALDANITSALSLLENYDSTHLSVNDKKFKEKFETRFGLKDDAGRYPEQFSPIDDLISIYKEYWRMSLLNTTQNYDSVLTAMLSQFLFKQYHTMTFLTEPVNADSLDNYLKIYLTSLHLHTTGFGKTGRLFDLLVWRTQYDTTYNFSLNHSITKAPVTFMDDMITLGWEEYVTLGKYYPGGWTTDERLFCVKKAYDLQSEDFLVSYLAHESRHFKDYKLFPKLSSADLEYRAKLTELSLAKKTLYDIIGFFISNANFNSDNAHSLADFCVIRDLSRKIFGVNFEKDLSKWKKLKINTVNKAAQKLLNDNTIILKSKGKDLVSYIKQSR